MLVQLNYRFKPKAMNKNEITDLLIKKLDKEFSTKVDKSSELCYLGLDSYDISRLVTSIEMSTGVILPRSVDAKLKSINKKMGTTVSDLAEIIGEWIS